MVPLEFRGETYLLPAVTQDDMDAMEGFCCARALAKVRAMAAHQSPRDNARDYDATLLRVHAGLYAFDEPGCQAAVLTRDGLAHLVWLCLRHQHPDLGLADVKEMARQKGHAWLDAQYRLANPDPTSPGAGTTAGGSGPDSSSSTASTPAASAA